MNALRNLYKGKGLEIAKEAFDRTILVGKFLCFLHVTNNYICSPTLVFGPSMLPTLSITGDLVLSEKISTRLGKVNNGDIVLVRSPENPKKVLTKRILGMEGDKVTYLVDPHNSEKCRTITVPKGHIWIQGDNIYASTDSRKFGPVPYGLVQGKVFWRFPSQQLAAGVLTRRPCVALLQMPGAPPPMLMQTLSILQRPRPGASAPKLMKTLSSCFTCCCQLLLSGESKCNRKLWN